MNRHSGFTLIEVLVALGIFSLVALMSYRGLGTMLDAEAQLSEEAQRWQRIENFLAEFANDVVYAAPRGGRDPAGVLQPALRAMPGVRNNDEAHLSLTRFSAGDGLPVATPQRVGYRFAAPEVVLLVWPSVDAAPRDQPDHITLLEGVQAASARYQDKSGHWQTVWPPDASLDEMPLAVELNLDIKGIGRITRLIAR